MRETPKVKIDIDKKHLYRACFGVVAGSFCIAKSNGSVDGFPLNLTPILLKMRCLNTCKDD